MKYRPRRWWHFTALEILIIVAIVGILVAVVIGAVFDSKERDQCRDAGGRVERYNFRTVLIPQYCGKGCTVLVPHQTSDWRCIELPAERIAP